MPDGMARISKPVAAHSAPPSMYFVVQLPFSSQSGGTDGNRTRITDVTSRRVGRYTTTPNSWWSRRASNPDPVGANHGRFRYATAPHLPGGLAPGTKKPGIAGCSYSRKIKGYPTTGATPRTDSDTRDYASSPFR